MNRFFRTLPLPSKLMLIGLVPLVFLIFLTSSLYIEKKQTLAILGNYINKIDESANLTRLIDNLQLERRYSYEYVLNRNWKNEMLIQRERTDSIIHLLQSQSDSTLKDFTKYSFLVNLGETRNLIDSSRIQAGGVMHFFSASIFRLNTLNTVSAGNNNYLKDVYSDMTAQKLISEMITYLGLVNANVFNILYHPAYVTETLVGTMPSYEVFKSYEQELLQKASPAVADAYRNIRNKTAVQENIQYLDKLFGNFKLDSTYTYKSWSQLTGTGINSLRQLQMNLLQGVQDKMNATYRKETQIKWRTLVFLIVALILVIGIVSFTIHIINTMLNELKQSALKIAKGEAVLPFHNVPNDVIGSLARSISEINTSNKQLAEAADAIGQGNFGVLLLPRSDKDMLGNALVRMKENLQRSVRETEESREQFRKLADFVPQIVWTTDPAGNPDYYNKQWYEYTGFEKGNLVQTWDTILHPDDVRRSIEKWNEAVRTGRPFEVEYRFREAKTGEYRWFLGRAVPVRNAEGKIIKWFGTTTDIHERKTATENLESLVQQRTQELERSNDDLQQFAHVASHDLKEPLRKIRMFSSRLRDEHENKLPQEARVYLEKIQQAAQRMAQMIEGVLNYSIANNPEEYFEMVDLNDIISEIRQDLELVIHQKNASIQYHPLPKIKGIRVLIYQLFYNLINNALKFSKPGEKNVITITAKKIRGSEVNGTSNLVPGREYLSIEVNDTGIGFDPVNADKMFQLFTRLNPKDKYEGTGLGLALCRKIALRHHGSIIAHGKENEGASFRVLLPHE